ncbi:4Fe-4S dicluster domain-containing protein [Chloroflexota bacterium]
MAKYGMVVDLNRCVRCRTCYVVCKKELNVLAHPRDDEHPYEYYPLRYIEWEWGEYPTVRRGFIPTHCMHCEDPICMAFCPVDAITQRSDGIVIIDKERCNECGVCAAICPYGAIYIDWQGRAGGCDFCAARLDAGGVTKCVEECPAGARVVGDLDDPKSKITKLVASGVAKPLLLKGVKNTRVYYIPSHNEADWDKLESNEEFQKSLAKRERDLPPVKGVL